MRAANGRAATDEQRGRPDPIPRLQQLRHRSPDQLEKPQPPMRKGQGLASTVRQWNQGVERRRLPNEETVVRLPEAPEKPPGYYEDEAAREKGPISRRSEGLTAAFVVSAAAVRSEDLTSGQANSQPLNKIF
mmetsp:Transcript_27860/g.63202  ORF Transcript_27860/g.63202 Transcript_27860/m.63202 type:complete len:132 (-) Transcript_27860:175-570(-)|eukprot:CAMPEP_0204312422 /NCGR_PEP_ID=MMETSP0469-20131031/2970_1 /ASSEMBLY_ACC=CAM_ASM_000384 /TAXON_ID=2969 /ORGANISM="Oxyrrhis marina" /LENGTH=131 /DNA_ID=CAMNT_0051292559 /DNA_START=682 /DNA_END=1077 /DNA_ORIENTATION=+